MAYRKPYVERKPLTKEETLNVMITKMKKDFNEKKPYLKPRKFRDKKVKGKVGASNE